MNSKKLLNSEFGLNHQGSGLSQQFDNEIVIFDAFLDAKGGNGKGKPDKGDSGGSEPALTGTYTSGDGDIPDNAEFNIRIEFYGDEWDANPNLKKAFTESADFLSNLILNDIAPDNYDDVTISASLISIDGPGGVLGRAGPTHIWSANNLTSRAIMEFDVADAQYFDGLTLWDDIVLHEMLHSIGFGTLWDLQGLVQTIVTDDNGTKKPTDDTVESVFTGANATNYSNDVFGEIFALVETDGGSGTAGGHWDETTYDNELMTGYINENTTDYTESNFLSLMSAGALEDMGYKVSYEVIGGTDSVDYFWV